MAKNLEWNDLGKAAKEQIEKEHPDLAAQMKGDVKRNKETEKKLKELAKIQERIAKREEEYEKVSEVYESSRVQELLADAVERQNENTNH